MKNDFTFEPLKMVRRGIIVDTDIGADCDDVGALAVMHCLANQYDIPILGIINCTSNIYGCGAIDVVNQYYGRKDIAIGMYEGTDFLDGPETLIYNKFLSETYKTDFYPVGEKRAEPATRLYRKLLAQAPEKGIILVTIGPFNTVANLLKSQGDDISPKDGITLVREKVYAVVSMAGSATTKRREFNICSDGDAAAFFTKEIPVPVIYCDFDLGYSVCSGFNGREPANALHNPVFQSYKRHSAVLNSSGYQNQSYDLIAMHFAFEGIGDFYRLSPSGWMNIDQADGNVTEFEYDSGGLQSYVELNCSAEVVAKCFDGLLQKQI